MTEPPRFDNVALRLRMQRMVVLASNIANADTPSYQARDLNFAQAMQEAMAKQTGLAVTSTGHIAISSNTPTEATLEYRVPSQNALDQNTVDMDQERAAFAENVIKTEFAMQNAVGEYVAMGNMFRDLRG